MKFLISRKKCRRENGQTLVMFVLFLVVLILFVGLGVDLGFAYVSKANLSKAVDASALVAMKNLSLGTLTAQNIGSATFAANYGKPSRDVGGIRPTPTFTWSMDSRSNTILNVKANTTINTFFIRVLPTWKTLSVSAAAQATRSKVIMSLVLDRSGSMLSNGGSTKLPPAVTTFINIFDDTRDLAGMASFASDARTDGTPYYVPVSQPFKTPIKNAANTMPFGGGTFSQGGLTNALVQINGVAVAPGDNVTRACVFFTDGLANEVQDGIFAACTGGPVLNYGGSDSGSCVGFFSPTDGSSYGDKGCGSFCPAVTTFKSAIDGTQKAFTRLNVHDEAEFRALQVANDMRANGIIVYAIGLGNNINQAFLQKIANDPSAPGYVPTAYDGIALFAPTSAELQQAFTDVANAILLRLTQ